MESSSDIIPTISNYFEWDSDLEYLPRSKQLYRITLGTKYAPIDASINFEWGNRNYLSYGLVGMCISTNL